MNGKKCYLYISEIITDDQNLLDDSRTWLKNYSAEEIDVLT